MNVLRKHTTVILMLIAPTTLVVTTAPVLLDILGMDSVVVSTSQNRVSLFTAFFWNSLQTWRSSSL